jgi:hypothetical protein
MAFRTQPRIQIFGLKLKPRQLGKINCIADGVTVAVSVVERNNALNPSA